MINYSSKYIDEIFCYVINSEKIIAKPNQPNELTVSHLHSYIGWRGYENGLGAMMAEARMAGKSKRIREWSRSYGSRKGSRAWCQMDCGGRCIDWEHVNDGVSFAKISTKLGNGLLKHDIQNRWYGHLKKSSGITKPPVQPGRSSFITWSEDVNALIVSMRADDISFAKIASEMGNGLSKNDIVNRWNRHLKDKLQWMLFSGR